MPKRPIFDIKRPENMSLDQQRRILEMVEGLDREQKTRLIRSIRIWNRASRITN